MYLFLFFLPDRPTHLHEREGDGKRNILLGWPKVTQATCFQQRSAAWQGNCFVNKVTKLLCVNKGLVTFVSFFYLFLSEINIFIGLTPY